LHCPPKFDMVSFARHHPEKPRVKGLQQVRPQVKRIPMITKTRLLISIASAVLLLVLCRTTTVQAATTVSLMSTGDGLFTIHGIEVTNASSMDIIITYDPSAIVNPQVVQGRLVSGAMMTVNTREPGLVRITVFREPPINGTGAIATLNFERTGEAQGSVTSLTARLTDVRGTPIPIQTQFLNSAENSLSSGLTGSGSSNPAPGGPPAVTAGTGTIAGTAETGTSLKDISPAVFPEPAPPRPGLHDARSTEIARRGPVPAADPAPRAKKVVVAQKSVLERFEEHTGSRTPQALIGLFEQAPLFGCQQEPSVVLADGKATAKVSFIAPAEMRGVPDVAVMNASLVSIERDRENTNTWVATVQPHRGSTEARMIISLPDKTLIIPLTVAPKVLLPSGASGAVTEREFAAYLGGDGGKGTPGSDLNGDGIVNHLDYFIYTANYLAGLQRADGAHSPGR